MSLFAKDDGLDNVLWFKEQHALEAILSGSIIKEKMKILAKNLKHYEEIDFQVINSWFWWWHTIGQSIIHGEKRSANREAALKFPAELKGKIDDLGLKGEQI